MVGWFAAGLPQSEICPCNHSGYFNRSNEMTERQLKHSPLIETTFYALFVPNNKKDASEIRSFGERYFKGAEFKRFLVKKDVSVSILTDGSVKTDNTSDVEGVQFERSGRKVLSLKRNSFSFTQLDGYENWESFCNDALEFYSVYANYVEVKGVLRIGVRCVDRIFLATGNIPPYPSDCLTTIYDLRIPFGDVEPIDFMYRDFIRFNKYDLLAAYTRVMKKTQGKVPTLFLDTDVFALDPNLSKGLTVETGLLTRIRKVKNILFFKSIHDEIVKEFDK